MKPEYDHYIFYKKEDSHGGVKLHKTESVTLPNIVEEFALFLRGCGFVFKELEIVYEEDK